MKDGPAKFEPTEWQTIVCRTVLHLLKEKKKFLVSQWVAMIEDFTLEQWKRWQKQPGFMAWWEERVTIMQAVDPADHRTVEQLTFRRLTAKLADDTDKDHAAMIGVVARMKSAKLIAGSLNPEEIEDDEEMERFMGGDPGKYWRDGGYTGGEVPDA